MLMWIYLQEILYSAYYRPSVERFGVGPYPTLVFVYGGPHVQVGPFLSHCHLTIIVPFGVRVVCVDADVDTDVGVEVGIDLWK